MNEDPKSAPVVSQMPALKQFEQNLGEQVNTVQQEARTVLPGIQTLFGFQLVAVFNQGFKENLSRPEQFAHLGSLLLIAIAVILVMAPTAYHREANHNISKHFVELSSHFLAWSMIPFAAGVCIDVYLITEVITRSTLASGIVTVFISVAFFGTWFVYPKFSVAKTENLPVHTLPT